MGTVGALWHLFQCARIKVIIAGGLPGMVARGFGSAHRKTLFVQSENMKRLEHPQRPQHCLQGRSELSMMLSVLAMITLLPAMMPAFGWSAGLQRSNASFAV